jgi:ATP-dependent exoDNAse (exonuclease V) alpha subunit
VRDGDVDAGLDWYIASGRVASFDDAATARVAMIETWWADIRDTAGRRLLMAERRVDVERLNQLARQRRADAGELDLDHVVNLGGRDFAVGDAVIFERNHRLMGVANAQRGTITALDRAAGRVTVDVGDGRLLDVENEYLAAGHLNWGYAATVHKNQGATCDAAYLLASDRTYRELGYVALSRGRVSNRIWTVSDHDPEPTENPAHGAETPPEPDPLVDLRRAMQRSAAQELATDQADELEPVGVDL